MDESLDAAARAPETQTAETQAAKTVSRFKWIGWSSLFLALVQSVCTIFVALSGLRLLIGAAAFGAAAGVMKFADQRIHIDPVRIPMVVFALVGAVFNLAALWQGRRVPGRAAPAVRPKTDSRGEIPSGKRE